MMEEYKSITNEMLCEMAQSGDKDAENELLQRYENRIIQIVRRKKYYIAGFDDDVWIQDDEWDEIYRQEVLRDGKV